MNLCPECDHDFGDGMFGKHSCPNCKTELIINIHGVRLAHVVVSDQKKIKTATPVGMIFDDHGTPHVECGRCGVPVKLYDMKLRGTKPLEQKWDGSFHRQSTNARETDDHSIIIGKWKDLGSVQIVETADGSSMRAITVSRQLVTWKTAGCRDCWLIQQRELAAERVDTSIAIPISKDSPIYKSHPNGLMIKVHKPKRVFFNTRDCQRQGKKGR